MSARLIAVLSLIALLSGCREEPNSWPKQVFVATQWAQAAEEKRYVFARDLIERQVLTGKNADEVRALLGAPSFESKTDHYVTYVIKTGGSGFNQIFVLDIRFSARDGIAEKILIRGD